MSLLKTSRYTVTLGHEAVEPQSASHTCPPPPPPPPPAAPPPVTQGGWPKIPVSCNSLFYKNTSPRQFHFYFICTDGSIRDGWYATVPDPDWNYYLEHGYLPHNGIGYI